MSGTMQSACPVSRYCLPQCRLDVWLAVLCRSCLQGWQVLERIVKFRVLRKPSILHCLPPMCSLHSSCLPNSLDPVRFWMGLVVQEHTKEATEEWGVFIRRVTNSMAGLWVFRPQDQGQKVWPGGYSSYTFWGAGSSLPELKARQEKEKRRR